MKLTFTSAVLLFFLSFGAVAQQTINDYHFVEVPDQFEFLKGKDQYQVNTLTSGLLNKYGFNAYLTDDLPLYLKKQPCKGLKAEVQAKEDFMSTQVVVVFKDCMGNVVYTSKEGKSKDKNYRRSYHIAIRQAFESIAELNMNQLALSKQESATQEEIAATLKANDKKKEAANTKATNTQSIASDSVLLPEAWFKQEFVFKEYSLLKQDKGYQVLYKGEPIGTAIQSNDDLGTFNIETSQFNGTGSLSEDNFTVYRQIEGMEQVITMLFKAKQ